MLQVVKHKKFGYYVENDNDTLNWSEVTMIDDSGWIKKTKIDKQYYIEKLKELGAYNNATSEYPRFFFKEWHLAEKAKNEFYEPLLVMCKLIS